MKQAKGAFKDFPTECQIGGIKYDIRYVKSKGKGKGKIIGDDAGAINQSEALIEICADLKPQVALVVLVHEMLHGVGDCMLPERSPFAKEGFTSIVSELLVQALRTSGLIKM